MVPNMRRICECHLPVELRIKYKSPLLLNPLWWLMNDMQSHIPWVGTPAACSFSRSWSPFSTFHSRRAAWRLRWTRCLGESMVSVTIGFGEVYNPEIWAFITTCDAWYFLNNAHQLPLHICNPLWHRMSKIPPTRTEVCQWAGQALRLTL